MIDTDPAAEAKTRTMMMEKSPEERFVMGCSMFTFVKTIVRASILQKNSDISPGNLRKELFLRFYGNDMDKEARDRIAFLFANSMF